MPKFLEVSNTAAAKAALKFPAIVYAADSDIVSNGITDVSVALKNLIEGLPSGTVLQLAAGDYYCPELRDVNVNNSVTIRGVPGQTRVLGDGALSLPNGRDDDVVFNVTNGSLRIEDVIFEDQGVVVAFNDLSNLGDIELFNCSFLNCGAPLMARYDAALTGERLEDGETLAFSNLRISRCRVIACQLGLWLQLEGGWLSVSITDNVFDDVGQAGVWIGFEYTPNTDDGLVALDRTVWQPGQGRVVVHGNVFRDIHRSDYAISNPGANAIVAMGQQVTISNNHIESVNNAVAWDDCEGIYTKARYVNIHDNILVNAGGAEAAIVCKGSEWEASTTIASPSNGLTLPQSTINVTSTEGFGFPFGTHAAGGSGNIFVIQTSLGWQSVSFGSKTATQFLGCSGGTGTLATGQAVRGNANAFNGLSPISTPNSIHNNTIVFTRTDQLQRGIMVQLNHCTIQGNLIVGATNQAINAYVATHIVNNVIREHHGTTAILVGSPGPGGGGVIRGNHIVGIDGSYSPSATTLTGISISAGNTEFRDIVVSDNTIRNELTAAGALSTASEKLRAVHIIASSSGTITGVTVRGNKARNLTFGIIVTSAGTISNIRDVDNDFANEAGSAPTSQTSYSATRTFRSIDYADRILDSSGNPVVGFSSAASAVNFIRFDNAATGGNVFIRARGGDPNVSLNLMGLGTAGVYVRDGQGLIITEMLSGTGTPVNRWVLKSSQAGSAITAEAAGSDTDVSINLLPKGAGTLKSGGVDVELQNRRNAANGYCGLDGDGRVAAAQLPSYVDDVVEFANLAAFPGSGSAGLIYVALDTNKTYRWSGSVYVEISPSPGSTDSVSEGTTNLYYTNSRADARIAAAVGVSVQAYNANLVQRTIQTITSSASISTTTGDQVVIINSGGLPTLGTAIGATCEIKLRNNTNAGVLIGTTSSQTIDGLSNFTLPAGHAVTLIPDNGNWSVF